MVLLFCYTQIKNCDVHFDFCSQRSKLGRELVSLLQKADGIRKSMNSGSSRPSPQPTSASATQPTSSSSSTQPISSSSTQPTSSSSTTQPSSSSVSTTQPTSSVSTTQPSNSGSTEQKYLTLRNVLESKAPATPAAQLPWKPVDNSSSDLKPEVTAPQGRVNNLLLRSEFETPVPRNGPLYYIMEF